MGVDEGTGGCFCQCCTQVARLKCGKQPRRVDCRDLRMADLLYFTTTTVATISLIIPVIELVAVFPRIELRKYYRSRPVSSTHYPPPKQSQKRISAVVTLITFLLLCFQLLSQLCYVTQQILCIPLYLQSTNIPNCPDIRDILPIFQLIFWHCSGCILFSLLSYRLFTVCGTTWFSTRLFTVLSTLIAAQILLFLSVTTLHFDELSSGIILQYILMTGYGIECILSIMLWILYLIPLYKLNLYQSERFFFNQFSGSITSEYDSNDIDHRLDAKSGVPRVFTISSIPTADDTVRTVTGTDRSGNDLNVNGLHQEQSQMTVSSDVAMDIDLNQSLQTSFVTAPYEAPPLKLKSDYGDQQNKVLFEVNFEESNHPRNRFNESTHRHHPYRHRTAPTYNTGNEENGVRPDVDRMVAMVMKYALLSTVVVTWKVMVIGFLMMHWILKLKMNGDRKIEDDLKEQQWGIWYFAVNMDCVIGGIAMYLAMNLDHSDRLYRKCCYGCDCCCEWMCISISDCRIRRKYAGDHKGNMLSVPFNHDCQAI